MPVPQSDAKVIICDNNCALRCGHRFCSALHDAVMSDGVSCATIVCSYLQWPGTGDRDGITPLRRVGAACTALAIRLCGCIMLTRHLWQEVVLALISSEKRPFKGWLSQRAPASTSSARRLLWCVLPQVQLGKLLVAFLTRLSSPTSPVVLFPLVSPFQQSCLQAHRFPVLHVTS